MYINSCISNIVQLIYMRRSKSSNIGESSEDQVSLAHNLPLKVSLNVDNINVLRVLISDECLKNIIFLKTFNRFNLTFDRLKYANNNIMVLGMYMEVIESLGL